MISKKERVEAVLHGQTPDRTPTGFWMHFPEECFFGKRSVKAHLDFFNQTKTDICKVMTEHLYPYCNSIKQAEDWRKVEKYGENADFIEKQAQIIKYIASHTSDASVLATIHGVFASASHTLMGEQRYDKVGKYAQLYHLRTNKEAVLEAYRKIADTLICLVSASIKAGADGIYYAALGGESDGLTSEEHKEFLADLDKEIIDSAYSAGAKYVVLHMCKPKADLKRFISYPCDVVNWGVEESGISLEEGRLLFPGKTILGGFNCKHGPLIEGTSEDIFNSTKELIKKMDKNRFILGADCTLPASVSYSKIAQVAEASKVFSFIN